MLKTAVATRTFSTDDQDLFGRLSGDVNPIHLDPVAARRTLAGAPVVHGVHAVIWALEALLDNGIVSRPIASLAVQFNKFIFVGAEVRLHVAPPAPNGLRAEITANDLPVSRFDLGFEGAQFDSARLSSQCVELGHAPQVLDLDDLSDRAGCLAPVSEWNLSEHFPRVADALGPAALQELVRLSTLVGMVCPGLYSVLSSLRVDFADPSRASDGLSFRVKKVDRRFRLAEIAVGGQGLSGTVGAFVRHPPVAQPSVSDLAASAVPGEFRGVTALIVGGSRGLGAAAAKAIAAGGGRSVITYVRGEDDALSVAHEIGDAACRVLRYDVREDPSDQFEALDWEINQLHYFATAQIFRQRSRAYDRALFEEYCDIYVNGLERTCRSVIEQAASELSVFYPSSVAIDEATRDLTEYCMAKVAGEQFCAHLSTTDRRFRFFVRRLPRILTDQTTSIMPVRSANPVEILLPILREMCNATRRSPQMGVKSSLA